MMEGQLALRLVKRFEDAIQHSAEIVDVVEADAADGLCNIAPDNALQDHSCSHSVS